MNRAREIFLRLEARGESAIDDFIATRKSEELFLDFKQSADDGGGRYLHQNDLKSLGRAISGFSNSEGGVLLWGVVARTDEGGADVAVEKRPLADATGFASRIEDAVSKVTIPASIGVRSLAIARADRSGFVATFIPKSPLAPHQVVPDGRYLIRAGSSFLPTPHGVLAGLFGRRPEPSVFHQFTVEPAQAEGEGGLELLFGVSLVSEGPGIASEVYLTLTRVAPRGRSLTRIKGHNEALFHRFAYLGVQETFMGLESMRLPPGSHVHVASVRVQLRKPFESHLVLRMKYGCSGSPISVVDVEKTPSELDQLMKDCAASPDATSRADLIMRTLFGGPAMPR